MAKFKTSARTVDMLGRQQIAGIPTAMSELFKNAYDAYATEVRADYFPRESTLVLRDNGIGMSETDFLERWLTLGTDSKTVGGTLAKLNIPAGAKRRQQMGEKGIGRLAIASIAPLVMVVTRATTESGPADSLTAALVPWSLFETPGLTLDEIDIPVISQATPGDDLSALLTELVGQLNNTVATLKDKLGPSRVKVIREQGTTARTTKLTRIPGLDGPQLVTASGTTFVLLGLVTTWRQPSLLTTRMSRCLSSKGSLAALRTRLLARSKMRQFRRGLLSIVAMVSTRTSSEPSPSGSDLILTPLIT